MFLAREKELTALNKLWNSDRFEMVVIYGRRRVGKTALINEFCIDKKAIIHISTEFSMQLNLESFSKEATYCIYKNASLFSSFEELFEFLYKIALDERIIIAIDEYPYLAKAYPEISSLLQKYIDSKFKDTRLMLILCGSSMSFMENQVLGYQSPLYGRRTAQMKILPFDYRETALMFPHYTYEEKAIAYGITGGIPLYAQILTRHRTLKEALLDVEEGADIIMVKPAMNYLDIIREVKDRIQLPVASYSVSGEYAMVKAGAKLGYIEEDRIICEMAVSAFRAGTDIYLTYFAEEIAKFIDEGRIG